MRVLLAIAVISGCQGAGDIPTPERGSVVACLGGPDVVTGEDGSFDITIEGVVTEQWAAGYNLAPCSSWAGLAVQIEDDNGDIWSLGMGVLDEKGGWIETPRLAPVGREVAFTYRYRHPWGDVSGFSLSDVDGLIAAVEEGSWGGALRPEDVPGLDVRRGREVTSQEETECAPLLGYDIIFAGDTKRVLPPVSSGQITIDGREYVAHALAAHEDGEAAEGCALPETPGIFAWAITR